MDGTTSLITVEQIPIIKQNLAAVKAEVEERTSRAAALVCTDDTVKDVKRIRADLNREFADFESARKKVKAEVLKPYEDFERVYKECISDAYKRADTVLKIKVAEVEDALREEKTEKMRVYFAEKCEEADIDFIPFEKLELKITLSAKEADLQKEIDAFLVGVRAELTVIETMDGADEIRFEYQKTLDLSGSILAVKERRAALEKAKAAEVSEAVEPSETFETEMEEEDGLPMPNELPRASAFESEAIFEAPRTAWRLTVQVNDDEKKALMVFLAQNGINWTEG